MADIRLMPTFTTRSPLAQAIAERSYALVRWTIEFFETVQERRRIAEKKRWDNMSYQEKASYLCEAMGCTCGHTSAHCHHLINDVLGK